jgi:hypothetical protein
MTIKKMKLWYTQEDLEVGLVFRWDGEDWVCRIEDDFFRELSPMPIDENNEGEA